MSDGDAGPATDGGVDDGAASSGGDGLADTVFPLPVDEQRLKLLFYGGILLYFLSHLWAASAWKWTNKLFPYIVGIPLVALVVANLVLVWKPEIREAVSTERESDNRMSEALGGGESDRPTGERQLAEANVVAWSIVLPVYVFLTGFAYGLPTYVFAFVLYHTRDWRKATGSAVAFTLFSYVVFVLLLNLRMYHGVLPLPRFVEQLPDTLPF